MRIVFDEPKREANLEKHGLDFADFESFEWSTAVFDETRQRPGYSRRYKVIGRLSSRLVAAVFTRLGTEGISLISLRPASVRERRLR